MTPPPPLCPSPPLRQQIGAHQDELQAQRAEEGQLELRAGEARERAAALRAEASGSAVQQGGLVAALMAAKAKGEVSGVYGRLGERGAGERGRCIDTTMGSRYCTGASALWLSPPHAFALI